MLRIQPPFLHILSEDGLDGGVLTGVRGVTPHVKTLPGFLQAVRPITVHPAIPSAFVAAGIHVEIPEPLLKPLEEILSDPPVLAVLDSSGIRYFFLRPHRGRRG